MAEDSEVSEAPKRNRQKLMIVCGVVLVAVFLLGLIPMGIAAYSRSVERDQARRALRACEIKMDLASAAIDARLGNYEPARVAASKFFTELRGELDRGQESVFDLSKQEQLKPLLIPRDEVITLLARGDPAAAERLSAIFSNLQKAVGEPQH